MLNVLESKVLDDLYETRGDGLEGAYIRKYGKPENVEKSQQAEEELTKLIQEIVKDEENQSKMLDKLNDFETNIIGEMCFWNKQYYKLGFLDGLFFKKEIRELKENFTSNKNAEKTNTDVFFNYCTDDFFDYFERQKSKKMAKREDYKKLLNKMQEIKNKYPKARAFIEDEEISILSKEEMQAVLDIIEIDKDIEALEIEEAFKLGLKENEML
jgi:hypothetical protein